MKIFVGCEFSATVGGAFHAAGHHVVTCDILESESDEIPHWQGDVMQALMFFAPIDIAILHPPCTALCVAGNRYYSGTAERDRAIRWTLQLWNLACECAEAVALENPVGVLSSAWRPPTQYIQPWQFGHGETKRTGLWLEGLPKLTPTDIVEGREERIWKMSPSPDRPKERSRFYPGIAQAMAEQWTEETIQRKLRWHGERP